MLRSEIERVSLQRPVKPFGGRQRQDRAVGVNVLAIEFACQTRSCKSPRLCCSCSGTNHLPIGHWIDCYLHSQCISRWLPSSIGGLVIDSGRFNLSLFGRTTFNFLFSRTAAESFPVLWRFRLECDQAERSVRSAGVCFAVHLRGIGFMLKHPSTESMNLWAAPSSARFRNRLHSYASPRSLIRSQLWWTDRTVCFGGR